MCYRRSGGGCSQIPREGQINHYLLYVEAVNLGPLINDTNDRSSIRGGSLMVLELTWRVEAALRGAEVRMISDGASPGSMRSRADPALLVRHHFANDGLLKHATIAVSAEVADTDYKAQRDRLLMRNRGWQMRAPSVVYPALHGSQVCETDRLRPAAGSQGEFASARNVRPSSQA